MLLQDDIELCRRAFVKLDSDNKGFVEPHQLCQVYAEMGMSRVTEIDLQDMLRCADLADNAEISFEDFVKVVEMNGMSPNSKEDSEADTLLAFISMGGSEGGEGKVDASRLTKTCADFGLTIDIAGMIKDLDKDGDGFVSFEEFKAILTSPKKEARDVMSTNAIPGSEHALLSGLRKGRQSSFLPETSDVHDVAPGSP